MIKPALFILVLVKLLQPFSQVIFCPVKQGFYRRYGGFHHFTDFLVIEAFHFIENKRYFLIFRQFFYRFKKSCCTFFIIQQNTRMMKIGRLNNYFIVLSKQLLYKSKSFFS